MTRKKEADGKGCIYRKNGKGNYYLRLPKSAGGKVVSLKTDNLYYAERERDRILAPFLANNKIEFLENIKAQISAVKKETADISDKFALCRLCSKDENGKIIRLDALELYKSLGCSRKDLSNSTLKRWNIEWKSLVTWLENREIELRKQQRKMLDNGKSFCVYPVEKIKDIDSVIASEYISYLREKYLSNNWMGAIYRFKRIWKEFGKLSEHEYFSKNPWENVKLTGKPTASFKRDLTPEEIRKLFEAVKDNEHLTLFVHLAFSTGARKVDVCNFKWEMFSDDFSFVDFTPVKLKYLGKSHKVAIPNHLKNILREQKRNIENDSSLTDDEKEYVDFELVKLYRTRNIDALMNKAFKRAGIETMKVVDGHKRMVISTHSLRHSYISMLANSGVSIEVTRKLATHTSDRITRDVYEHLNDRTLIDAVSNIPDLSKPIDYKDEIETVTITKEEYDKLLDYKAELETLKKTLKSLNIGN